MAKFSAMQMHSRDTFEKIELFRNTWLTLMKDHGQTMPLKVHIILEHLSDYFEQEGKTLISSLKHVIQKSENSLTLIQTSITKTKALICMEMPF